MGPSLKAVYLLKYVADILTGFVYIFAWLSSSLMGASLKAVYLLKYAADILTGSAYIFAWVFLLQDLLMLLILLVAVFISKHSWQEIAWWCSAHICSSYQINLLNQHHSKTAIFTVIA